MEILNKFNNSDVWIRSVRKRRASYQFFWSMSRQFFTCNYVESFRFKISEQDSPQWWMTLDPNEPNSQFYIPLKLKCSEPASMCTMYQLSLVNRNSNVLSSSSGNGTEKHLETFIERKERRNHVAGRNHVAKYSVQINCRLTEYGDLTSEAWERSSYDEIASRDESVDLLFKDLKSLINGNSFYDVTLKGHSSSETCHAHRDILKCRSKFLKNLLWDQSSQPLRLPKLCPYEMSNLSDEAETIKQILVYLYSNKNGIISHQMLKNLCCASYGLNLRLLNVNCLNVLLKDRDFDQKSIMKVIETFWDYEHHEIWKIIHCFVCHHEADGSWEDYLKQNIGDLAYKPLDSYLSQNESPTSGSCERSSSDSLYSSFNCRQSADLWKGYFWMLSRNILSGEDGADEGGVISSVLNDFSFDLNVSFVSKGCFRTGVDRGLQQTCWEAIM